MVFKMIVQSRDTRIIATVHAKLIAKKVPFKKKKRKKKKKKRLGMWDVPTGLKQN